MAWSYSKLKDYETCPHRLTLNRNRAATTTSTEALAGIGTHEAVESFIKNEAPLPSLNYFMSEIEDLKASGALSELQLGIDRHWKPSDWTTAWGRCVLDAFIATPTENRIVDFKNGNPHPIAHTDQAQIYSAIVAQHHPNVPITVEFWYLQTGKTYRLRFDPNHLNALVIPRLTARIDALENDRTLRPNPIKYICQYCKYKDSCDFAPDP